MLSVPQRYRRTDRRTDGRTDGRTTYDSNTALALRASRGKNVQFLLAQKNTAYFNTFNRATHCVQARYMLRRVSVRLSITVVHGVETAKLIWVAFGTQAVVCHKFV